MTDTPTAAQIAAFLEDDANVEALTDAVQELHRILRDGTADRPPRGILPIETIQTMTQEDHRRLHSQYNPPPFRRTIPTKP